MMNNRLGAEISGYPAYHREWWLLVIAGEADMP